jgi:hypothetical protein
MNWNYRPPILSSRIFPYSFGSLRHIIPKILTDSWYVQLSVAKMGADNILACFAPLFGVLSDRCKSPRGSYTLYCYRNGCRRRFCRYLSFGRVQLKIYRCLSYNPGAQPDFVDAGLSITLREGGHRLNTDEFTRDEYVAFL